MRELEERGAGGHAGGGWFRGGGGARFAVLEVRAGKWSGGQAERRAFRVGGGSLQYVLNS
jgi:hypothetical protein